MDSDAFAFDHPTGICVSRALTEMDLLKALSNAAEKKMDLKTGWTCYRLPAFVDGDQRIGCSLWFNRGKLDNIGIAVLDPEEGAAQNDNWSGWSAETERLRARKTEQWLVSKGYAPGTYTWGAVWAGCDPKTGDGGGVVSYLA